MGTKVSPRSGVESQQGFLLIVLSNTFLFSGESAHELIFLDLGTGEDFAMPVTEEQASMVASVAASSLVESSSGGEAAPTNAFEGVEEASQL